MAFACPHCTKDIPDVVPQATLTDRLNVKETANEALRNEKTALEAKVARLAPFEAQVTTLQADLEKQKGASAKVAAAAKVGFNPEKMKLAETVYEMAHESLAADKRPAFDAWLADENGARKNDDIKHLFAGAGAPPPPGTPPAPKKPETPPGNPPPAGNAPTAQQVDAYFKSPEFRNLPRDKQREKMAELEGQVKTKPTNDGRV